MEDSDHATDTATEHEPPKACHLLRLAPELRNHIYDLAFSPKPPVAREPHHYDSDFHTTPSVKLVSNPSDGDDPPWPLLLTCRSIYDEAHGIYQNSFERYWSESVFEVRDLTCEGAKRGLSNMTGKQLSLIQQLTMLPRDGEINSVKYGNGVWTRRHARHDRIGVYVILNQDANMSIAEGAFCQDVWRASCCKWWPNYLSQCESAAASGQYYVDVGIKVMHTMTKEIFGAVSALAAVRPLSAWEMESAAPFFLDRLRPGKALSEVEQSVVSSTERRVGE